MRLFIISSLPIFFVLFLICASDFPKTNIFGKVTSKIDTKYKKIFLTFDDGPNGKWTQEILNILNEFDVKATFFLAGKSIRKFPYLVKKISQDGHSMGNHSYSHSYFLPFFSPQRIKYEILETENLILKLTGKKPCFFRPPHGLRTPWLIKTIKYLGYKIVTWDVMASDYSREKKAKDIVSYILKRIKKGSIIIFHDGVAERGDANREELLEALKILIPALKEKGYQFEVLER